MSPLLSNIYLDPLDHLMAEAGYEMVRYADDFVVLCRSPEEAAAALAAVRRWTAEAGLTLHPSKTRLVDARSKGFDFLGYRFNAGRRWPRSKSLRKLKDTIRAKTKRTSGHSLPQIIADTAPWAAGSSTSSTATAGSSASWTAGYAVGCEACCANGWAAGVSPASTATIIGVGPMLSLPSTGSSACRRPMPWPVSPLVGKTTDRRAGCGRTARPVRRAGRATPFPTPITSFGKMDCRVKPGNDGRGAA